MRCNGLTCWIASRSDPACSLLNSSVGISRSLDGDDAYVTDIIDITNPHYMILINEVIKCKG